MNVRHVDHYHKDWIADSVTLGLAERGLDETAFNLVCNRGGPVRKEHLRKICPGDKRIYDRAVGRLIELGKLVDIDGTHFDHPRAEAALESARKRIETVAQNRAKSGGTAAKNERKSEQDSRENSGLEEPSDLYTRESTSNQPPATNHHALFERESRARPRESAPQSNSKSQQGHLLMPLEGGGASVTSAQHFHHGGRNGQTRIPDDWSLSNDDLEYARRREGWDDQRIEDELENFRNHYASTGDERLDWSKTWRSWVGKDKQFSGRRGASPSAKPGPEDITAVVGKLMSRRRMEGR